MSAIAQRIERHLSQLPPQRAERLEHLLIGLLECIEPEATAVDETPERQSRRSAGMAALNRIAARGGIAGIPDPLAWQREQRAERPLPGREP